MDNYESWSRDKLIEHLTAYSESLHSLANHAMKQEYELKRLRSLEHRLARLNGIREMIHGGMR